MSFNYEGIHIFNLNSWGYDKQFIILGGDASIPATEDEVVNRKASSAQDSNEDDKKGETSNKKKGKKSTKSTKMKSKGSGMLRKKTMPFKRGSTFAKNKTFRKGVRNFKIASNKK